MEIFSKFFSSFLQKKKKVQASNNETMDCTIIIESFCCDTTRVFKVILISCVDHCLYFGAIHFYFFCGCAK